MNKPLPCSEVALRFMQYFKNTQETKLGVHDELAAYCFLFPPSFKLICGPRVY